MRGEDHQQAAMFSYFLPSNVPANHPLRKLRPLVDTVLTRLSPRFTTMYARNGRPSIAPEKLLRALLLQFPPRRPNQAVLQHVFQHVVRAAVAHAAAGRPLQVPCLDLVVDPPLSQVGDGKECPHRPLVADVDVCLLIRRMASTLVGFKNLGATESRYSIRDI